MILYIDDEYCSSVEQLKSYFDKKLTDDSDIYCDLVEYGRLGGLAQWLSEMGEDELSEKVASIGTNLADSDFFAELQKVVTGVSADDVAASLKPPFERCFQFDGIEYIHDEKKEKEIQIKLKVLREINERYELKVSSSWGTRGDFVNSSDYNEGETIELRLGPFHSRGGKGWEITGVKADGKELLSANELKRCFGLQPQWASAVSDAQKSELQKLIDNMVKVEGGSFKMGATSEQGSDAYDDEKPAHEVTLGDYYIGRYEVTQALWKAVMGSNPSYFKGAALPVERVSWHDCDKFIEKLNTLTGLRFRLPTEAEWEYAARGGNKSRGYKYPGSNTIGDVAWNDGNSSSKTHPVGGKSPNELGLYDMGGNVWEWCSDWYGNYPSAAQTNPSGPSTGSSRVLRGGSWVNDARGCRVSNRGFNYPGFSNYNVGLRLALRP